MVIRMDPWKNRGNMELGNQETDTNGNAMKMQPVVAACRPEKTLPLQKFNE